MQTQQNYQSIESHNNFPLFFYLFLNSKVFSWILKEKQFKERKCDLCNYKYAQVLITTEQNEIHLCPNHLIALVMRDLEKQDAVKLREKYGKDITWLDDEIYADDGTALQPA